MPTKRSQVRGDAVVVRVCVTLRTDERTTCDRRERHERESVTKPDAMRESFFGLSGNHRIDKTVVGNRTTRVDNKILSALSRNAHKNTTDELSWCE